MSDDAESYVAARDGFLRAASAAGARLASVPLETHAGRDGEPLAMDIAATGPLSGGPAVVVLSGVHGVEGFAGSAVQRRWLQRLAATPSDVTTVFVHAVNPWGFSWLARCDEANVDLNRNMVEDFAALPRNDAYAAIHPILAAAAWSEEAIARQDATLEAYAAAHGAQALTDAMIGGQYDIPDGLNYGGAALRWQTRALCRLVDELAPRHEGLVLLDLHTGIAPHGAAAVLPFSPECGTPAARALLAMREGRFTLGAAGLARMTGILVAGLAARIRQQRSLACVVEFGTVERAEIRRALRIDLALRLAPPTDRLVAEAARRRLVEAFWPSSPAWRASLLELADAMIDACLHRQPIAAALGPDA